MPSQDDLDNFNKRFNHRGSYFKLGFDDPPVDNSKEIDRLTKKIEELEKDLKTHISGKYGVLYVPTHEELLEIAKEQIKKEQIKKELKKINGNKILV